MRDREFAVAKKALVEGTQDKTTIPESFRLIGNNVLHGKKGKQHTVVIGVPVPSVKLDYGRIELMGDGKLLEPPREFEVHSWLRNHFNMKISALCYTAANDATPNWGAGYVNGKDTGATIRSSTTFFAQRYDNSMEDYTYGYMAPAATTNFGIVVGTDDTEGDEDDHVLYSMVAHGVNPNQLYYATSPTPAPDYWDTDKQVYQLSRYFDNFSGGTITLKEMGQISYSPLGASYYFLVSRDVISPSFDIPFRAQAKISYEYGLTYGSSSPLRNYFNSMFTVLASVNGNAASPSWGNGYLNGNDTSGNIKSGNGPFECWHNDGPHTPGLGVMGAANIATHGIQVGSNGAAGVTFEDYVLNTLIAHGAGGGQLNYSVGETPLRSWSSPVMTTSHARTFTNGSGGNVTVTESGVVGYLRSFGNFYFLLFHDAFASVIVANGESLRLVYQLKVTFP